MGRVPCGLCSFIIPPDPHNRSTMQHFIRRQRLRFPSDAGAPQGHEGLPSFPQPILLHTPTHASAAVGTILLLMTEGTSQGTRSDMPPSPLGSLSPLPDLATKLPPSCASGPLQGQSPEIRNRVEGGGKSGILLRGLEVRGQLGL